MFFLGLILQLAQIDRALGNALQRMPVELVQMAQQPFVDAVDQQQHLDALLAKNLELRAALRGGQAVGGDDVDRLLTFLHAADVVGERHAFVGVGRGETQQLGQSFQVGVVFADAFFQHRAEVLPERRVLGALGSVFVVGQAFEHAQHTFGRAFADRFHVAAFLEQLALPCHEHNANESRVSPDAVMLSG